MREAITHLKSVDPRLAEVIDRVGPFCMNYREPCFETMVRSIVYQQVSGKAAATVFARLETALGAAGVQPEALLLLDADALRACGLSGQKSRYLRDLAEHSVRGSVQFHTLHELPDDAVIEHLTAVKGVGVWTAQMFLMFALKRPDILPTADLGIRNAMQKVYKLRQPPKPERMVRIAKPWRPYTSIACWYLWRSLDGTATL
jgi:DNA-3-methyladenine glycosylase II